MDTEIHQLRHRELIREADRYRLAREAMKTEPASQAAAPGKSRPSRLAALNRLCGTPWRKRRVIGNASTPHQRQ
ncbi:hypothetical protein [Streptomyces sp. CT34]|uniref:hypothetical protein n=1 Tax=Streptomyces sp. CT34 TaxID=1553907 RepID=UPI0012FEF3FD|nr:hypothetical protein [Streptomyces sp. CT34]